MHQLTASLQELIKNPLYIANNVKHDPVAIMADDKAVFFCVNEKDFLEFLAFKHAHQQTATALSPKKSALAFAGVFKDKTTVRLDDDELNQAIVKASMTASKAGLDDD